MSLEEDKIKKGVCPKCGDGLKEFTETKIENGRERVYISVVCNNYYCRWEKTKKTERTDTEDE